MDAVYSIELQKVSSVVDNLDEIKKSLVSARKDLERVKNNLNENSFRDIVGVLNRLMEQADYSKNVELLQNALMEIVERYKNAEEVISGNEIKVNKTEAVEEDENKPGYWNKFKEGFWDNFLQELISTILTSGSYRIASVINMLTALVKGPAGENSFVILNPNVASSTGKFLSAVSKGLAAIGFAIDFGTQIADGESFGDALIKSGAHLGIGVAVGAIIGSIIPGPGTAAGAAAGLAIGTVITYGVNTLFDYIYDAPQDFMKNVEKAWDKATDVVSDVADEIGNAVSGLFGNIGTVFAM